MRYNKYWFGWFEWFWMFRISPCQCCAVLCSLLYYTMRVYERVRSFACAPECLNAECSFIRFCINSGVLFVMAIWTWILSVYNSVLNALNGEFISDRRLNIHVFVCIFGIIIAPHSLASSIGLVLYQIYLYVFDSNIEYSRSRIKRKKVDNKVWGETQQAYFCHFSYISMSSLQKREANDAHSPLYTRVVLAVNLTKYFMFY